MSECIFFRDEKEDTLRGPFSERQLQAMYRARQLKPLTRFYFTKGDVPASTNRGYTLMDLRTRCGIGCPFMNPASLPATLGSETSAEERKFKGIKMGLAGIRAQGENMVKLEKEIDRMDINWQAISISARDVDDFDEYCRMKINGKKKKRINAISPDRNKSSGPTRYGLNRAERLERLSKGFNSLRTSLFDALSLDERVKRASDLWRETSVGLMRTAAALITEQELEPMLKEEALTEKILVDAMNNAMNMEETSIADIERAPEKPAKCSRATWLTHVKMSKKFASVVHHACMVMRTGSLRDLDEKIVTETVSAAHAWYDKWECGPLKEKITQLVDYEIVKRLKEIDYFYCHLCKSAQFNLKQGIAHFADNSHNILANEAANHDMREACIDLVTTTIQLLTKMPREFQDLHTTQFTLPLLKSGMKIPSGHPDSFPSPKFLAHIKAKYEEKINGPMDSARLAEPAYMASIMQGIVRRHKSEVGLELFKEIHEYMGNGKNFYCKRCGWMLTTRERFYKHLCNVIHIGIVAVYDKDTPHAFCLLTYSVNIHASDVY